MSDPARTSWKDPDWLAGFTGWATEELAALGFEVTGPPEQTHIRPWSTVVRLPAEGGPFWAKAMRPSTSHEARLLPAMGAWGVSAVIAPLAVEEVHSWMLLEDGGPTLRQTRSDGTGDHDLAAWEGFSPHTPSCSGASRHGTMSCSGWAFRMVAPRRCDPRSTPSSARIAGGRSSARTSGPRAMRPATGCARPATASPRRPRHSTDTGSLRPSSTTTCTVGTSSPGPRASASSTGATRSSRTRSGRCWRP